MTSRFSPSQSEMEHGVKQYDKEQVKMVSEFLVAMWASGVSIIYLKRDFIFKWDMLWYISANNFLQSKDIFLQIARYYLSIKLTCFMFLVELNRLESEFKAIKLNKYF